MIETVVESIRVSLVTQHRVVILKEVDGERHLPIWIGSYEAEAIAMELQGVSASRPLPYDLMRTIIDDMGGTVDRIAVEQLFVEITSLPKSVESTVDGVVCRRRPLLGSNKNRSGKEYAVAAVIDPAARVPWRRKSDE